MPDEWAESESPMSLLKRLFGNAEPDQHDHQREADANLRAAQAEAELDHLPLALRQRRLRPGQLEIVRLVERCLRGRHGSGFGARRSTPGIVWVDGARATG